MALQAACEMVDAVLEATPCTFGVEGERRHAAAFNAAVYSAATGTPIRLGGVLWVKIPPSGIPRVEISPREISRRKCVLVQ